MEKNEENQRNQSDCRSIIREFCLNTTAHGLPGIARGQTFQNRLFWSIGFSAFCGTMIYFITNSIIVYFDYPTSMDTSIIIEWPQYFPAFSFCNVSPFRADKFVKSFFDYLYGNNLRNSTKIFLNETEYLSNFIVEKLNQNESIEPFFYSLSSMLYSCSFNIKQCTTNDFIPFLSSTYGLCFTFNAKVKNQTVRFRNENGGDGILRLGIYVHSHQYVDFFRPGIGIVFLVHENTQVPLIESAGSYLSSDTVNRITIRKKKINLLSSPYSSCRNEVPRSMELVFDNYHDAEYGYTGSVCMQICRQDYLYEQCGCVSPHLWNSRSIIIPGTNDVVYARLCYENDTCFRTMNNKFLSSSALLLKYCSDCTSQCSMTDFAIQTSFLKMAIEYQSESIKSFVENTSIPLPVNWSNTWLQDIRENYLSVTVSLERVIVENNTQSPSISPVDLLSNIGGQTGLWIGISFLSLMEIIEMFYRLIRHRFRRTR